MSIFKVFGKTIGIFNLGRLFITVELTDGSSKLGFLLLLDFVSFVLIRVGSFSLPIEKASSLS